MSIHTRHLVHPGEREFPACNQLELIFKEALTNRQTTETAGNLVVGSIDERRRVLSATLEEVLLSDSSHNVRTGLILQGRFRGCWANRVYDNNWLLARASTDPQITPIADPSIRSSGHTDVVAWRELRRAIHSGVYPANIRQFTVDLKDIQKSLATLNHAR